MAQFPSTTSAYGIWTLRQIRDAVRGSNWPLVAPDGTIVQLETIEIGPTSQTINSNTLQPISGMSVDFTPLFDNSTILIQGSISTNSTYVLGLAMYKDGSPTVDLSTLGETNNNDNEVFLTTYIGSENTSEMWSVPFTWYETSGSTTQRTYQLYASSSYNTTVRSVVINNRASNDMASFSHMTIMEIFG